MVCEIFSNAFFQHFQRVAEQLFSTVLQRFQMQRFSTLLMNTCKKTKGGFRNQSFTKPSEIMLAQYFQWLRADIYASRKSGRKWNRILESTTLDHHHINFVAEICIPCESVFVLSKLMISFTRRHKWYLLFMLLFKCLLWNPLAQAKNKAG